MGLFGVYPDWRRRLFAPLFQAQLLGFDFLTPLLEENGGLESELLLAASGVHFNLIGLFIELEMRDFEVDLEKDVGLGGIQYFQEATIENCVSFMPRTNSEASFPNFTVTFHYTHHHDGLKLVFFKLS